MAKDKLKLINGIKIFLFVFYFIYFIISNINLVNQFLNRTDLKADTELKRELLSSKCLLLLGGSNVRMGLSAEEVSVKSCQALNLGISSEGGGFINYLNWIDNNISADKVIYSSAFIWQDSLTTDSEKRVKFPNISIFAIINSIIFPLENTMPFNQFGDQVIYQCLSNFPPFSINTNDFAESNYLINHELYERIIRLKEVTNSNELYFRIPPVYVKTKSQAELYTKLMSNRIEILKGLGVQIIGSTIVSTDISLFCNSFHPNAKGREVFTKEILLP